ncbi:MAG TPA: cytochrome c [Verrucomicrobiae bacterium]|nr:cytochrome c [Verrucomicrobiae bacterium]
MKRTIAIMMVAAATVAASRAADSNALWDQHCAACHGKDGSGKTKMGQKAGAKDYRDPKVSAELQDEKSLKAVKEGLSEGGKEKMKPFKAKLSDEQIKSLIGKMKEFGKK